MTQEQQTQLAQLEETIRVAQQQIDELKNPKPKKFEWKYDYGKFWVGTYEVSKSYSSDSSYIENGRYRLTKEAAEQSFARNKRANRLEALAEQLGGLKEFKYTETSYFIQRMFDHTWRCVHAPSAFAPERVYMTMECAIEICRMLNSGEFSLEGEL